MFNKQIHPKSNDCAHPAAMLDEPVGFIKITELDGKVRILRIFMCKQCETNIAIENNTGELVAA
jgi:hypothetical protein